MARMSCRVQIVSKLKRAYTGVYKLSLSAEKTDEKHVGSDEIQGTAVLEGTASDTAQYRMSSAERVDPDRQARNRSWQVLANTTSTFGVSDVADTVRLDLQNAKVSPYAEQT